MAIGLGGATATTSDITVSQGGLSARSSLTILIKPVALTARILSNPGGRNPYALPYADVNDHFYEAGFLIGYVWEKSTVFRVIVSGGGAVVWGQRGAVNDSPFMGQPLMLGYKETLDPIFGIPLELGFYSGKKHVGFGLIFHANYNAEETLWGITANLLLGSLGQ